VLEEFVNGFFLFAEKLNFPFRGRKLFYLSVYLSQGFSKPHTAQILARLGVKREKFYKLLDDLTKDADLPEVMTLEQMIKGLIGLWARLDFPDDGEIYRLTHWFSQGFDRVKGAQALGISLKTLNKRIERLTKKIGLTKPPLSNMAS